MKKILTTLAITGLALGTLTGCEEKKPEIKKATDAVKDAGAKMGDAAKEGAAKVGEAAKDATKPATPAH